MSYDMALIDQDTKEVVVLICENLEKGGTYMVGENYLADFNITYNYAKIFRKVLGDGGIRSIYGMTGREAMQPLSTAIIALEQGDDYDYWAATESNARRALESVLKLSMMAPDGVWEGD